MGREDLATKLLRIMCCRDGCSRTFEKALGNCCDCCADCLMLGRGANKLSKQEIEYVISADQGPTAGGSLGGSDSRLSNGRCRSGYVNEACTEATTAAAAAAAAAATVATTPATAEDRRATFANNDVDKDIKNELYQKIQMRRSSSVSTTTPVIDWKSIQFWTVNTNKEPIQPMARRPSLDHNMHFAAHTFKPQLYELHEHGGGQHGGDGGQHDLTDDEKLEKFGLGQLHFSVQYDVPSKLLLVKVIEARDLVRPVCMDVTKQDMSHSNPYVRVCLLPDQKNARQTSVKRKTQCPVFDETFAFELPYREVQMRTLQLKVKDFDKYSRHCLIGHVMQPLVNINLVKGRHMWKPLMPCEKEQPDLGDILISLNYLPSAGRLIVDVIKAKQLLQTDLEGGSVPFVRVSLVTGTKHWKSKKTSHKKNTIDPVFNESFSFNVSPTELSDVSVVLTAWDSNSGLTARDDFIGRVVVGRHATGPDQLSHWDRMLRAHRSPVAQWHTLCSRQQADQLSPASLLVP